jgi:hypothetical protein
VAHRPDEAPAARDQQGVIAVKRTNAQIRAEGEEHVFAELRRRGVGFRQIRESRRIDLELPASGLTVQIRVTSLGVRGGWLLTDELEGVSSPQLVYAFVNTQPAAPETFLIPAPIVSEVLRASHAAWLATPGRGGRSHRDTPMRMILDDYRFPVPGYPPAWLDKYRERWDLLGA